MNILDQNIGENLLNEYQANRKKTFLIFGCLLATFVCVFIYNYGFYNPSFGRVLWEAIVYVFFVSIIPAGVAAQSHFTRKNPRNAFLIAFAVQSAVIVSAMLVLSQKNDNLTMIYFVTVFFSAIIFFVFFSVKSFQHLFSNWKEAGLFSAPVIGILAVFMIGVFLLTGRLGIPGPLLWVVALAVAGWFATIKYRKNMEKRLGREVKGEYELSSFSSWMEVPAETVSGSAKFQIVNNHKAALVANISPKISSSNNASPYTQDNNQFEEQQSKPFVSKSESLTKDDVIKMRENLTALLEIQRTKGSEELEKHIQQMFQEKSVGRNENEKESNNPSIEGKEYPGKDFRTKQIGRTLSESEAAEILSRVTVQPPLSSDLLKPRLQHYLFAHKYLPDKLTESPQAVLTWLAGEKGVEHLKTRWALLPTIYQIAAEDHVEPNGIDRYLLRPNEDHTLIIIRFPEPIRMTEAYFASVLLNRKKRIYRYFTLELSFSDQGGNIRKTVLGEWIKDKRINHGDGSLPGIESFSSFIIDKFI